VDEKTMNPVDMLHLAGCPVARSDAEWLVAELTRRAQPGAASAASKIETGLVFELTVVSLTALERAAVISVLEDPPAELRECRGALVREQLGRDAHITI
jgi:hypothetical protein